MRQPMTRRQFFIFGAASAAALSARAQEPPAPFTIRQDWHMHTWRAGAKKDMIVKDMIAANAAHGLTLMGISEHIDREDEREEFKKKLTANREEALAAASAAGAMKVMIGTESTMINPKLSAADAEIAAMLDYRLISCNHYHLKHVENPEPTADAYANHYLDMLWGATELGYADTIGHPFYHQKLSKIFDHDGLMAILKAYNHERLSAVLKKAAEVNMAFELQPRHVDHALDWFRELLQEARLHGTKFTIGTDAHDIPSLGYPDNDSGRTCGMILADLGLRDEDLKTEPITYTG
ncbi:MAG: PHP domain-containing protein [Candidatus Hydrogenedentes bacterium]|nr:PHP domain-containing protein [Candidatus Hydrogenedentota bacterium]